MLRRMSAVPPPWRQPRLQAVDCPRTAGTQPPGAGLAQPAPGLFFKETLNKSSSAEQRIFSSIRAASKPGNIAQPLPAQAGLRMRHTPCGYTKYSSAF